MDLFKAYIQERERAQLLKHEHGFAIYRDEGAYIYLQDVFVLPTHRQQGIASSLAAEVFELAKKSKKSALITSVDTATVGATQSATAILKFGFQILKTDGSMIWFQIPIED